MQLLSAEILLKLFACLDWRQLVTLRLVCKQWKETTRSTSPSIDVGEHGHLSCMYWLFPRARCLTIVSAAEESEELEDERDEKIMVERLKPICTFRHLTKLVLTRVLQKRQRNGDLVKYSGHIFQVPTLEELVLEDCHLSFDLSMVSGTPLLRQLIVKGDEVEHDNITGNLSSLAVLKDTLTHLVLTYCENVHGSFSDLGTLPRLEYLGLKGTSNIATHDDVNIKPGSFQSLTKLNDSTFLRVALGVHSRSVQFTFDRISSITITLPFALGLFSCAPNLREINFSSGIEEEGNDWRDYITGKLSDLRVLRDTLRHLDLHGSRKLTGSIADLRDFPLLEHLNLANCPNLSAASPCLSTSDLPSLAYLNAHIHVASFAEVPSLMKLLFCRGAITCADARDGLVVDVRDTSFREFPDFYGQPILAAACVKVGPRIGWRWNCREGQLPGKYYFETNWLNTEPKPGDSGHDEYWKDVEKTTKQNRGPFVGLYMPPKTYSEYKEIVRHFVER